MKRMCTREKIKLCRDRVSDFQRKLDQLLLDNEGVDWALQAGNLSLKVTDLVDRLQLVLNDVVCVIDWYHDLESKLDRLTSHGFDDTLQVLGPMTLEEFLEDLKLRGPSSHEECVKWKKQMKAHVKLTSKQTIGGCESSIPESMHCS